jgi:hypothetical protein
LVELSDGGVRGWVRTFDGSAEEEASCVDGVLEKHSEDFTGNECLVNSIQQVVFVLVKYW